jgi:hypothetical protein
MLSIEGLKGCSTVAEALIGQIGTSRLDPRQAVKLIHRLFQWQAAKKLVSQIDPPRG